LITANSNALPQGSRDKGKTLVNQDTDENNIFTERTLALY